jgi:beta-galactosidase/beta-glucuronidase
MTAPLGQPANADPATAGPATDPAGPAPGGADTDPLEEIERLRQQLADTRQEAARRRIEARDAKTQLVAFEEWKKSQMSDSDRALAEVAAQRDALLVDARAVMASKYRVPEARIQYVAGTSPEEIEASAKALGEPENAPGGPNLHSGRRGVPVGSGAKPDANAALRDALKGVVGR